MGFPVMFNDMLVMTFVSNNEKMNPEIMKKQIRHVDSGLVGFRF